MRKNKRRDMTPFDMARKPCHQSAILMPLIWGASYLATRRFHLKLEKSNMEGVRPPFLVLSTHQGFSDYYIAPLALFPHRANYVSDMEGFAAFGNTLYRKCGCIGKRRYVPDTSVVRNISYVLHRQQGIVVLFPESRHSNVGTTAQIPDNMGKLAKVMGVPLVILSVHGSYLANPFWDEEHTRHVPMKARLECIYTAEQLDNSSAEDVQKSIEQHLAYNEYEWQKMRHIKIADKSRASGLHKALYQCPCCKREGQMYTQGALLCCAGCGAAWKLDEFGELQRICDSDTQNTAAEKGVSQKEKIQIPRWYEWEREQTIAQIEQGSYQMDVEVTVEALPNEKGFVSLGDGRLRQNEKGWYLQTDKKQLFFSHKSMESLQTEYNYRKKGTCIVLSTRDCCYYVYPQKGGEETKFQPTKMQFATEYFHACAKGKGMRNLIKDIIH